MDSSPPAPLVRIPEISHYWELTHRYLIKTEEYTRGFEVFDPNLTGFIKVGELRYILTHLGEAMTDEEVDELLKLTSVSP